jgi:hypothetical protein
MSSTEKWIAGSGVGLSWSDGFSTATLNSIASGNAILSDVTISNGTSLDIFCDISIHLASAAFVSPNLAQVYLYPLQQDSSTYGDGRFSSSVAGPPAANFLVASMQLVAATQAQDNGFLGIIMPPGTFKFVYYNLGGVALASSGNLLKYRTYNRTMA